jgi:hypothetical protein
VQHFASNTGAVASNHHVGYGPGVHIQLGLVPLGPSVTVAFSFSSDLPFQGTDPMNRQADGAWGAAVNPVSEVAIDNSGWNCEGQTAFPHSCGNGNGGTYEVCGANQGTRWVALAIWNTGFIDGYSDGEGISYLDSKSAADAALANCGNSDCKVVWVQPVDCARGGTSSGSGGAGFGGNASYASGTTNGTMDVSGSVVGPNGPAVATIYVFPASDPATSGYAACLQSQTGNLFAASACPQHATPASSAATNAGHGGSFSVKAFDRAVAPGKYLFLAIDSGLSGNAGAQSDQSGVSPGSWYFTWITVNADTQVAVQLSPAGPGSSSVSNGSADNTPASGNIARILGIGSTAGSGGPQAVPTSTPAPKGSNSPCNSPPPPTCTGVCAGAGEIMPCH